MSVSVEINRDDIARVKRDFMLMNDEVPVAQSRVINRTLSAVNTEASVQVRKVYKLKATRVKKNFSTRKATKNNLNAHWKSVGVPVGLINFDAKQNRKGVSVKVLISEDRKTISHAFIQITRRQGTEHVFLREIVGGARVGRYDIERREGPRVEDALSKPEVQKALQKKADDIMQKRLEAEASYILSKAGS